MLYTQKLLHTDAFTQRRFYTQKFLYTDAFTHRRFYTQNPLRTDTFTHRPFNRTSQIRKKKRFSHSNFFSCESGHFKIAVLLTLEPHFVRKGCRRPPDQPKSQSYSSFCHSNLVSCERVADEPTKIAILRWFLIVFDDRTSFCVKGWPCRGASSAPP